MCHVYHPHSGDKQSLDKLLVGDEAITWQRSLSNEIGRLAQGIGASRPTPEQIKGTNTLIFIPKREVPRGSKITYINFVCDIRQHKKETHRTRATAGGDRLEYHADPSAPAIGILDTKIHLNSVISDSEIGARYCVADIKDYYLNNQLAVFQYVRIH